MSKNKTASQISIHIIDIVQIISTQCKKCSSYSFKYAGNSNFWDGLLLFRSKKEI